MCMFEALGGRRGEQQGALKIKYLSQSKFLHCLISLCKILRGYLMRIRNKFIIMFGIRWSFSIIFNWFSPFFACFHILII